MLFEEVLKKKPDPQKIVGGVLLNKWSIRTMYIYIYIYIYIYYVYVYIYIYYVYVYIHIYIYIYITQKI